MVIWEVSVRIIICQLLKDKENGFYEAGIKKKSLWWTTSFGVICVFCKIVCNLYGFVYLGSSVRKLSIPARNRFLLSA